VVAGVGAGVAVSGLRFPNPAIARSAAGSETLAGVVGACAPAYGLDASPEKLAGGLQRYLETSGDATGGYVDFATRTLVEFDDGVLATGDAPAALRALNASAYGSVDRGPWLDAARRSAATKSAQPGAPASRPGQPPRDEGPEQQQRLTVLSTVAQLMELAARGCGLPGERAPITLAKG